MIGQNPLSLPPVQRIP